MIEIINHRKRIVTDGEECHGLQTTNLKNSSYFFRDPQTVITAPFNIDKVNEPSHSIKGLQHDCQKIFPV